MTLSATDEERSPAGAGAGPGGRLVRITALFLAVLLPGHLVVVVAAGDIGRTTLATVTDRLSGSWWPGAEWATLVLALFHGFLVVQDRLVRTWPPGPCRDATVVATGVAGVLAGLAVTAALLTLS